MVKNLILAVLVILAAGTWFYLDQLNKAEQVAAEQTRQEMAQARAEAQRRAAMKNE